VGIKVETVIPTNLDGRVRGEILFNSGHVMDMGDFTSPKSLFSDVGLFFHERSIPVIKIQSCLMGTATLYIADASNLLPCLIRVTGCAVYPSLQSDTPIAGFCEYIALCSEVDE
jgi:hypothetical protein